ncbi:MAG: sigma-54-dependent Fis family transcriptional regulator [Candidatus Marinimicrobia bacterium]|nr:sigma-54-dependent Fis family transcriptional regulator [Candidatus Neomarinimicrobiota bacterium]
MSQQTRILVIDDEPGHCDATAEALTKVGYECVQANSASAGIEELKSDAIDVVVTDLKLGEELDGLDILREALRLHGDIEVIVVTGHGTIPSAVEAIQLGAASYLTKPLDINELRAVVAKAVANQQLRRENRELHTALDKRFSFEQILGNDPKILRVLDTLQQITSTDATVLIHGESGTGKELIAKAIHHNSPRCNRPFVALNCASLSEGILESELFGHEKGSFTGASDRRVGRFEHADGGTLLLDEVGDMPISTQIKLLRVIEERQIMRVGSNEPIDVDVRLLAATNADLQQLVKEKKFRQDLFFRLNVVAIRMPPLRERKSDIPLLTQSFIKEFAHRHGKEIAGIAPSVSKALAQYDWPGNVRELRNCIESMVVVTKDAVLGEDDLPSHIIPGRLALPAPRDLSGMSLQQAERELISTTLDECNGNRKEAAKKLGIGERTLYRKLNQYDLKV